MRLHNFSILNSLQDSANRTNAWVTFLTNSLIIFSLGLTEEKNRGNAPWKFNNSLTTTSDFITKIKINIKDHLIKISKESISVDQCTWQRLKYEFRKFPMQYSIVLYKIKRTWIQNRENKLKNLESTQKPSYKKTGVYSMLKNVNRSYSVKNLKSFYLS